MPPKRKAEDSEIEVEVEVEIDSDILLNCNSIEVIDSDGDVYLICSKPQAPPPTPSEPDVINSEGTVQPPPLQTYAFLASTKTLSLASPVFRRAFETGSRFFQRKTTNGKHIFNVDDAEYSAALLALKIVHFRRDSIPEDSIALQLFHDLAIFADLYNCAGALATQADVWMRNSKVYSSFSREQVPQLGKWLLVAFVFKVGWFYKYITEKIMMEGVWEQHEEGGWTPLIAGTPTSMKPDTVLSVHQRIPARLLEKLRLATEKSTLVFGSLAHSFVKTYYLIQQSYIVTQDVTAPPEKSRDGRHGYLMDYRVAETGLWARLVLMSGLQLEHPTRGKISSSNVDKFSKEDIEACQTSVLGCSMQRFLEATVIFKADPSYSRLEYLTMVETSQRLRPATTNANAPSNPGNANAQVIGNNLIIATIGAAQVAGNNQAPGGVNQHPGNNQGNGTTMTSTEFMAAVKKEHKKLKGLSLD